MKKLIALIAVAVLASTAAAQTLGPNMMSGGVWSEDFDSMGVGIVVPNDGASTYYWKAVQNGTDFAPAALGQNGGSTDPDWVNWGTPSVGAASAYNQGMESNSDRALGLYKTGTSENPNYLETQVQLDVDAPLGLELTFDVEVPMARYPASDLKGYTTNFEVYADGSLIGASTDLQLDNMTNITAWSWTDDTAHYWLSDAQMVDGQECERGVTLTIPTAYNAGDIITLKWEIGTGSNEQRMHTGLDNVSLSVIPEPATMSLLAIGGVAALIRRKK